jgi:hypothetical protein
MLLTRTHHFGTAFSPPDASLAVFFLAGLWIASGWVFGGLLVIAALADQIAFASNVSNWCVTAAYGFLIPAYGAMWAAGKFCRNTEPLSIAGSARILGALAIGSALYFAVSNGSFFWLSGYFDTMTLGEYWSRTIKYFPWYLGWAAAYSAAGILIAVIVRAIRRHDTDGIAAN